jgi:hypothetical protein
MKELTTEVYGLRFFLQNNRICFLVEDKPGWVNKKISRHWVDLNSIAAKKIGKIIAEHIAAEEEEAKLTPAQLAEKYEEMMGS